MYWKKEWNGQTYMDDKHKEVGHVVKGTRTRLGQKISYGGRLPEGNWFPESFSKISEAKKAVEKAYKNLVTEKSGIE